MSRIARRSPNAPMPVATRESGQTLMVFAFGMIAILLAVGLIVDGGNAWAQQRITQNGTDASAESGATVLGQRLSCSTDPSCTTTDAQFDTQVASAVNTTATANGITVPNAYYTDICGVLLKPDGTQATGTSDAARVGSGLPTGNGPAPPACPNASVGPVAGVFAVGSHTFPTYMARLAGINSYTAQSEATAVAGFLKSCSTLGTDCPILPIAFPTDLVSCPDGSSADSGTLWPQYQRLVIPICKNGPGNVGWIDWSPPNGGTSELISCVTTPCNPGFSLPTWLNVAQTGNPSSSQLENAINTHDGEVVLIPMFGYGLLCSTTPDNNQVNTAPNYGCSNLTDPNGNPQWYRIQQIGAFQLEHAYTNGNNTAECNPPWSNPPAASKSTDCLIGTFVNFVTSGDVGGGNPGQFANPGSVAIQLIH